VESGQTESSIVIAGLDPRLSGTDLAFGVHGLPQRSAS
jgi:hypothetical protein